MVTTTTLPNIWQSNNGRPTWFVMTESSLEEEFLASISLMFFKSMTSKRHVNKQNLSSTKWWSISKNKTLALVGILLFKMLPPSIVIASMKQTPSHSQPLATWSWRLSWVPPTPWVGWGKCNVSIMQYRLTNCAISTIFFQLCEKYSLVFWVASRRRKKLTCKGQ